MRKKYEQTIDLMNERLRRLENRLDRQEGFDANWVETTDNCLDDLVRDVQAMKKANDELNERIVALKKKDGQRIDTLFAKFNALADQIDMLEFNRPCEMNGPPEPPLGSIIRDCDGYTWQRTPSGWWTLADPFLLDDVAKDWQHVQAFHGPTTILYYNVDNEEIPWLDCKGKA